MTNYQLKSMYSPPSQIPTTFLSSISMANCEVARVHVHLFICTWDVPGAFIRHK